MPFHSIPPCTMWAIFRLRKLVKVIVEYRLVTVKMMQGTVNCLPPRTQTARARRPVGNPAWRPYSSFLMAVGMWRPAGSPVRRNRSTRRSIRPFHPYGRGPDGDSRLASAGPAGRGRHDNPCRPRPTAAG